MNTACWQSDLTWMTHLGIKASLHADLAALTCSFVDRLHCGLSPSEKFTHQLSSPLFLLATSWLVTPLDSLWPFLIGNFIHFDNIQVGSILNFSLMYLLAPTGGSGAAASGLVSRIFSESTLKAWGAPG